MTLKETVNKDFIQARKDKDTLKADVLRLIKTEYDSFIIDNKREMTEVEEIHVFMKDIKKPMKRSLLQSKLNART